MMKVLRFGATLQVLVVIAMLSALNVLAVAPHPDLVEKWKAEGVLEEKLAPLRAFRAAGGNSPELHTPISKDRFGKALALGTDWIDTAYTIVILVQFTDNRMDSGSVATQPYQFDSVLFSEDYHNPTGSMTDFYKENSYGNFIVTGDIFGPYTMPNSYQYYENDDYGLTWGGRLLATHAVMAVEGDVPNWRKYDANGDDWCDGLIIIHAGPGAEEGGISDRIWSHKGNISPLITHDGVKISAYTMNPEEFRGDTSPIGVFCHEFGHVMGLPDLYDVKDTLGTSNGLGDWAIMATGCYNGGSRSPSHFTAWSKAEMGFLAYQEIDENVGGVEFPCSEFNPVAYRLQNSLSSYYEFWVVENRQRVGSDVGLPSSGLCIYHVDRHAPGPSNQNPNWYHVALEQADGKNDLAFGGSHGNSGDVWPGSTGAREFQDLTVPNTHTNIPGPFNNDATTRIGVWNISNSDSVMTADLDVDWSRPWPLLADNDSIIFDDSPPGGDGDGILEPGETIKLYCTMKNVMRTSFNATVSLSGDNPAVTFITNQAPLASVFDETEVSNLTPIEFTLASSFVPAIDSLYLTVTCDSIPSIPYDSVLSRTFGLEVRLGPPQVLIVDDDRGEDYEQVYIDAMYAENIPYAVWHKQSKNSPTGDELKKYRMVFWHTGEFAEDVFTSADVAAMKEYLDAGGNLLLSSNSGAKSLNDLDVGFMNDYLGANWAGSKSWFRFQGVAGSQLGDGTRYRYGTLPPDGHIDYVTLVGSGQSAFKIGIATDPYTEICGVTKQEATYNSIFLTFPIEYLSDGFTSTGYNTKQELFSRVLDVFGGIPLDADDGRTHAALPMNFDLHQNYPNPFNPTTTISYTLRPTSGRLPRTTLSIFNLLGQQVVTLIDKIQLPGTYNVQWDGKSQSGQPVATGIYFYKLSRGDDTQSRKMILLK